MSVNDQGTLVDFTLAPSLLYCSVEGFICSLDGGGIYLGQPDPLTTQPSQVFSSFFNPSAITLSSNVGPRFDPVRLSISFSDSHPVRLFFIMASSSTAFTDGQASRETVLDFTVNPPPSLQQGQNVEGPAALENVLDFTPDPLTPTQVREGQELFGQLMAHCKTVESPTPYRKATLVHGAFHISLEQPSFLACFFEHLDPGSDPKQAIRGMTRFKGFGPDSPTCTKRDIERAVDRFSNILYKYMLVPLKASGAITGSPEASITRSDPSVETAAGVTGRASSVWQQCLIRDHHRCVVSRKFHDRIFMERLSEDIEGAVDDDGRLLKEMMADTAFLEVAHILPPSLVETPPNSGGDLVSVYYLQ